MEQQLVWVRGRDEQTHPKAWSPLHSPLPGNTHVRKKSPPTILRDICLCLMIEILFSLLVSDKLM